MQAHPHSVKFREVCSEAMKWFTIAKSAGFRRDHDAVSCREVKNGHGGMAAVAGWHCESRHILS